MVKAILFVFFAGNVGPSSHFSGGLSCDLHCCQDGDRCNGGSGKDAVKRKGDYTVDWLYIVILYLMLPFMITMAKFFFPLMPLPPRRCEHHADV